MAESLSDDHELALDSRAEHWITDIVLEVLVQDESIDEADRLLDVM